MAAEKGWLGKALTLELQLLAYHRLGPAWCGQEPSTELHHSDCWFWHFMATRSLDFLRGRQQTLPTKCDDETTGGSLAPRMTRKTCNVTWHSRPLHHRTCHLRGGHPILGAHPCPGPVMSILSLLNWLFTTHIKPPFFLSPQEKLKNPLFHPPIPRHSASAASLFLPSALKTPWWQNTGPDLGLCPAHSENEHLMEKNIKCTLLVPPF